MNRVSLEPKSSASASVVDHSVEAACRALIALQQPDGHWVFELEADATIPAEYVLLRHYLAEPIDAALEAKIAVYLRRIQGDHGGWPLFHDGAFDLSASVKAYFALKMIGDSVDAPHMVRAREAIRARGGASRSNVFTRMMLALFDFIPWRAVPVMPVEIMLLPKWFPFHLDKVSYWSRTVLVPLLVLQALKPRARNPKGIAIEELSSSRRTRSVSCPRRRNRKRCGFGSSAASISYFVPLRSSDGCDNARSSAHWHGSRSASTARMVLAPFFRRWRTA
jgi:squalene-hopene/tetraprenyl-beta-curcumene cyclase